MNNEMKTILVEAYTDEVVEASIHDGDPGEDGSNEVSGLREAVVWNTVTINGDNEAQSLTNTIVFTIPADTDIFAVGLWNTSGDFRDSVVVSLSYPSAGTYAPVLKRRQP